MRLVLRGCVVRRWLEGLGTFCLCHIPPRRSLSIPLPFLNSTPTHCCRKHTSLCFRRKIKNHKFGRANHECGPLVCADSAVIHHSASPRLSSEGTLSRAQRTYLHQGMDTGLDVREHTGLYSDSHPRSILHSRLGV